ncbi:MAG: hypothetical protein GY711_16550 [bacterium]|nr:hypothetical protein [bacterium]
MKWWAATFLATALVTAALAAAHWAVVPAGRTPSMQQNCSACHAGSAPRTHTRAFVDREHGPAARADRQECLACHGNAAESCHRCHREQPPDWHTGDFRNPVLGVVEMREHIRIARGHRESCGECHTGTYMTRCVGCHRPDEGWLGRLTTSDRSEQEFR